MMHTIISVIVFFVILSVATLFWDLYNSSKESNLSKHSAQGVDLINIFGRDGDLKLVGIEADGNSDILVEIAIEAIEMPENLRIAI